MNIRIINAPRPDVLEMLEHRMRLDVRERMKGQHFDAVGLVQSSVADLFFFADIASKAAAVTTVEILGNCPQHMSTLAVFGETSAVRLAMQAIETEGHGGH